MPVFALLQNQAPAGMSGMLQWLPIVAIGVLFYFLIIRPQSQERKKMEERLSKLKAGDEVLLTSGLFATIDRVEEKVIWLKLGDKTLVKARRQAVAALATEPVPEAK